MTDHPTPSAPGARVKLTKAQKEILAEIAGGPRHYWHKYQPALKLEALGYATRKEWPLSSPSFTITEAGRLALSQEEGHE